MILNYITAITIVIAVLITLNCIVYLVINKESIDLPEVRNMLKTTMYIEAFIFVIYLFGAMIINV